ncbi:hypothetical protein C4D60_Mb08t03750 [Musa balbisiana]|uniref:cysteine dioxygenase n=1 Tax=Musa balbisiana TaxID=52838 RepID=A0A4S8K135_MUSBA|nr:hypothetical protein C4D60_Mb08t03750 [Musa balbisiana]
MGVDGGLADPKGRAELATEKYTDSSRKKKRRQKKPASTPSAVQRLFETCKEVFAHGGRGFIPSADDVERLRSVVGRVDVGYAYCSLQDLVHIGIFCLPQAAVIPLHNHPGMTVVSKLLFGSMHIKSYDWVNDPEGSNEKIKSSNGTCLAKVNTDAIFKAPCETSVLYPTTGGNMHCFTAVTSCAVLDVLGPPYNDDEGRACTYYKEYAFSSFPGKAIGVSGESKEYAWLEERESKPDDLVVRGAEYRGPKIVGR